jgi:hypothetical protein
MTEHRSVQQQFMGSTDIPLSVAEYHHRYQPDQVPHIELRNPNDTESIRVDLIAYRGGTIVVSVLIRPGEMCKFPALETMRIMAVPFGFVHAPTDI